MMATMANRPLANSAASFVFFTSGSLNSMGSKLKMKFFPTPKKP